MTHDATPTTLNPPAPDIGDRFVYFPEVQKVTGLGEQTIRRAWRAGRFPRPVEVSIGRIAWRASVIRQWLTSRPEVA